MFLEKGAKCISTGECNTIVSASIVLICEKYNKGQSDQSTLGQFSVCAKIGLHHRLVV